MNLDAAVTVRVKVVDSDTCDQNCRWFDDYGCRLFPDETGYQKSLRTTGNGKTFRVLRCDECKKATGAK